LSACQRSYLLDKFSKSISLANIKKRYSLLALYLLKKNNLFQLNSEEEMKKKMVMIAKENLIARVKIMVR